MTKFQADPDTISAAAKSFHGESTDISKAQATAEHGNITAANAGRDYGTQGAAYATAYKKLIDTLLKPMATKTQWASTNLKATADHYTHRDSDNAAGIKKSGKGA